MRTLLREGAEQEGGQESTLSLIEMEQATRAVSLRAPFLLYYGVLSGQKVVGTEEGGRHTVGAGESLLVPPLQSLEAQFDTNDGGPARWVVLQIEQETVRAAMDRLHSDPRTGAERGRPRNQAYYPIDGGEGMRRVLRMIRYLFRESPPDRDALIDLSVQQLVVQLLRTDARPLLTEGVSRNSVEGGLAAAVQHIQNHLDRHISIDELVDVACMSKSSFYRHFSDEFEMSPLEYITQQRVARARSLLADTSNTVAAVSRALGFSSTSYFIDMFKDHVGTTPKQYQLEIQESSS